MPHAPAETYDAGMPPAGVPPERSRRALRGGPGSQNAPRGPDTLAELGGLGSVVGGGRLGLCLIEASPPRRRMLVRDSW